VISPRWRVAGAALAAGLLGLLACARPTAPALEPAAPALWRAEAPEAGTLYLLGSVHMGTRADLELGPGVEEAWQSADELVVEIDLDRVSDQELSSLTLRHGKLSPPLRLWDLISGETRGQLEAWLALRGLPAEAIAQYKPWFASLTVVQVELQLAGYDPAHGVDRYFIQAARGRKSVVGLETVDSQLELMDRLPASLQELMLQDALARVDEFPGETAQLLAAWGRGDDRELEALVFAPLEEMPELGLFYDLVFFQRNANMASRLAELSGDGRTRFVVVGAGHMLGDQGIPALLARRGYSVSRVR